MFNPPDQLPTPSRLLKFGAALARWFLWALLAFWLLFAVVWGTLHGLIVPRIGEFRPRLEMEASRALGVPVRIGAISAYTTGMIPSFELGNVTLLDPQGREALRLPRVMAALSPRSLLQLGFDQLYIDQPVLDVRRAVDGRIFVAGLDFSRKGDTHWGAADWFFSQSEFVIHQGSLRWTDDLRSAAPLALQNVDVVLKNSGRSHTVRIDATPPPVWGDRFTLTGRFRGDLLATHPGRWEQWDGQTFGDFARVDVSQLRNHLDLGVTVRAGHGAVRLWADVVRGHVAGGTADLLLADVDTTLGEQLPALALKALSGRVGGRFLEGGFELQTENLQFVTAEGVQWPGGNVFVNHVAGGANGLARGELRADRLDLAALAQLGNRLPLGTTTHARLKTYAPKGLLEKVQATWRGPLGALSQFEARGRVSKLEVAAQPGAAAGVTGPTGPAGPRRSPGVQGLDMDFDFNQAAGKAHLSMTQGHLELPGVWEEPVMPLDLLSADVAWQSDGAKLAVQLSGARFANADVQGELQARWKTNDAQPGGMGMPGLIETTGSLSRLEGTRVHRYMPMAMYKPVRDYVRDAVIQGRATDVRFRIKGDLRELPFADPKRGEFNVTAKVQNATYAFAPRASSSGGQWPALTQVNGELVFDHASLQIRGASAGLTGMPGVQILKADALIPDLMQNSTVTVSADARGPVSEVHASLMASPLAGVLGPVLGKATATGSADYRLRLVVPVHNVDRTRVQGSVSFAGNDVQITPETPLLGRARGVLSFTESAFALSGIQARMYGGDMKLEGGSKPAGAPLSDPSPVLRAQGVVSAEGLRQAREMGFLSRLLQGSSGSTAYSAVLGFRRGVPELQFSSTLQGLALNMPAPLNKAADVALPLRFETALTRDGAQPGATGRLQDQLTLDLGRLANMVYVRDLSGPEPRVIRGSLAVGLQGGETAPLPEEGVMANINLARVDLDAWQSLLTRASGVAMTTPTGRGHTSMGYVPNTMAVRAKELMVEGRTLHNVVVGGFRDGALWRANLESGELNGYVEYRQAAGAGSGRIFARLARLSIPQSAASEVEAMLEEQPGSIPALDIVVDDFELRGRKLGRIEVDAVNRGALAVAREGGVREWRLNKFNLSMPEAVFTATGNWAAVNAQGSVAGRAAGAERRRTVMNFRLEVADSGDLLNRFGMKDVVRHGKGKLEGQVSWAGSPLMLDYASLGGQFNVNVETGQFLKADPGLAKLLGVLSLQSLPRRLTLDFRDVFSEGFAFDFVRGDVRIEHGMATTNNLQMKGVNAAVLMEGRADIARETQDIKVVVVPEINAGTASLVATVINPAVGIGSFLAQMFLRRPLIQANTQEFHIDGTWADPRILKVVRPTADESSAETVPESKP